MIEAHNLTHCPFAAWCEICVATKSETDQHLSVDSEKRSPLASMDYQYMSATGEECSELQARATVLTIVDTEVPFYGALVVHKKGVYPFVTQFVATFLDRMNAEEVRVRYDNEPSLVQLVNALKALVPAG